MRILVLQHVGVEHPGVFRDFWMEDGYTYVPVELDEGECIPSLQDFDLMVSMGGPMDVWQESAHRWLVTEKAAIKEWVQKLERPFLGICLGHQLLADALGGAVGLMDRPEVGVAEVHLSIEGREDRLFSGLEPNFQTFQWHGAEVSQLPGGAICLARNDACSIQALRYGRHAYGLQYHCEITASTMSDWRAIPEYAASLERALGRKSDLLQSDVEAVLPNLKHSAWLLHQNLSAIVKSARF